jgi:hypothetical protein
MKGVLVRFALLLIVAVMAVAVWIFVVSDEDGPETTPPRARLYTVPQDDIVSVAVQTVQAAVTFERRGGVWYFAQEARVPVNLDRWGGIVLLLSGPEVERVLSPPSDLHEFGLGLPSRVSVGRADGRQVAVLLGAEAPDGRNVYAQLEGGPGVVLVNEPWASVLLRLATAPPLPYWYYRVDPALVRIFEVENESGITTFLLGLPGTDGDSPARVVQGDTAPDLSGSQHDAVLHVAGGPPGFAVSAWPEGLTPEDAGLDTPRAIVRVTYELAVPLEDKSAVSMAYAIGARAPEGDRYYAVTPDSPLLLTFDAVWVEEVLSLLEWEFEGTG